MGARANLACALFVPLVVLLLFGGCAVLRPLPRACRLPAPRLSGILFRTDDRFWFTNAVVSRGYHKWGIAPEEVLSGDDRTWLPMNLSITIAPDCKGAPSLRRSAPNVNFPRISGRARYILDGNILQVDCICSVEPTPYIEDHGKFWDY